MKDYDDSPEEVVHKTFNKLRGVLAGLIESWGLEEKRERGAIQTLKTLTYDSEDVIAKLVEDF